MPTRRGILMCLGAALLFGLMAFGAKLAVRTTGGAFVAFVRFAGAAALVAAAVAAGRVRLRAVSYAPLAVRGLFGGLAVLLYFVSIDKVGVGLATLLNCTSPLWTALWSRVILRERLRPRTIAGLALALGGVTLVLLGERGLAHPATLGWIAVGVASAACSGVAVTAIRVARRTDGPWEIFAAFTLVGVVCTAPFAFPLPAAAALGPAVWAVLAGVVVVSVAAQILMTTALKWVDAPTYGAIGQLSVVVAFACGIGLFDERLPGLSLAGSALTVAGVAFAAYLPAPKPAAAGSPEATTT
ncbi:MAG TPA: DMT family transporter [Myxococcota bacterium]|jgi:drug/metabolite transporter (DMT)-like permease|nr:DMT family transporter [Myxococcota bacterium]